MKILPAVAAAYITMSMSSLFSDASNAFRDVYKRQVYIYLKFISYNMKTLFVLLGMFVIYPCLYAQDAELQACREELARGMSQKNRDRDVYKRQGFAL